MRKLILTVVILVILLGIWNAAAVYFPDLSKNQNLLPDSSEKVKLANEESVVIDIVKKITPSVVTVGFEQQNNRSDPFSLFERRGGGNTDEDIGSGFIVRPDGLVVTNKHVVSQQGNYKVITSDGKKYDVVSVYRDPANDLAILKIETSNLRPVEMGDSSRVEVGQLVVAVGTPLGEFRGTVTKGIVSGKGRGITAGSPFEGFVERLDDVIQTDAAINPGNSGGPLVNSSGQVIGVNTAIASGAENIGFAIPINILKEALNNFSRTGGFNRPHLGVVYRIIDRDLAIARELVEGAYVQEVIENSSAAKAGIQDGDIITKFDGKRIIEEENGLAGLISKKKVGDNVDISIWRNGQIFDVKATLEVAPSQ